MRDESYTRFSMMPELLGLDDRLSARQLRVLHVLCMCRGVDGSPATPSREYIRRFTGLNKNEISRATTSLAVFGWCEKTTLNGEQYYKITVPVEYLKSRQAEVSNPTPSVNIDTGGVSDSTRGGCQIRHGGGVKSDTLGGPTLIIEKTNKKTIEKTMSSSVAKAPCELSENTQIIFNYWKTVMDHPRAKLDTKRRSKITAALKLGYTVDELRAAVDGCKASPYHQGQNDRKAVYDDIELICRDAAHIERFIREGKIKRPARASDGFVSLLGVFDEKPEEKTIQGEVLTER